MTNKYLVCKNKREIIWRDNSVTKEILEALLIEARIMVAMPYGLVNYAS